MHSQNSTSYPRTRKLLTITQTMNEMEDELRRLRYDFELVYQHSSDLLCLIDSYGFISRINAAWTRALGWAADDLLSKPLIDIVHPQDRVITIKTLTYPQCGDKVIHFENRLRCCDGFYKWFEVCSVYIPDRNIHFCILHDISEHNQAVEIVQQTREELESRLSRKTAENNFTTRELQKRDEILKLYENAWTETFEHSPIAQVLFQPSGEIAACNSVFVSLFGFDSPEEAHLQSFANLYAQSEHFEQHSKDLIQNRVLDQQIVEMRKKDGASLTIKFNAYSRINPATAALEFHGFIIDVTEQKKIELYITQKQNTEVLGTIARGIAHDFNNILGIIMGYTSIIANKNLSHDKLLSTIDTINRVIDRGSDITKQILSFTHQDEHALSLVDVNSEIQQLTKMMKATFPKRIRILLQLEQNLPNVLINEGHLHQVLLNICVNARDAIIEKEQDSHEETIALRTFVISGNDILHYSGATSNQPYVCIEIQDSGKGIEAALLPKIFEPFFTTKKPGLGTGLGLSVVNLIVKSYNGSIDVHSELGKGTTFSLLFPASNEVHHSSEEKKEGPHGKDTGGTETLLFAEDEMALALAIKQHLESKGYSVLIARDGTEALQLYTAYQKEISLVILDIDLPILDGTKVLQKIRRLNPEQKVILASGYLETQDNLQFSHNEPAEFIQKPYQPEELLKKIRDAIDSIGNKHFSI